MLISSRLVKDAYIIKDATVKVDDTVHSFHSRLEQGFLQVCRDLGIPLPMWMKKNTRELACFRMTFFQKDQFPEEVFFDRMEFTIEEP